MVSRRFFLGTGVAVAATYAVPVPAYAADILAELNATPTAANIPFIYAIDQGLFRLVGLDLATVKGLTTASTVDRVAINDRCINLLQQEVKTPGQFKIIALTSEVEPSARAGSDRCFSAATLSTQFLKQQPAASQRYIAAYNLAIECLRENPAQARAYLEKFDRRVGSTMPEYKLYRDLNATDIQSFQKRVERYHAVGTLSRKVNVPSLLLKNSDFT
jgi:ABC-type nitrate/sulfonate/bicarbonate transport system substrate-binding protein